MKLSDFTIGSSFKCSGDTYMCTDIGTRVIIAVCLSDHDDKSWFNGPPYAVAETVFDEDDQQVCY